MRGKARFGLRPPPPVVRGERFDALAKACAAANVPVTEQRKAVLDAVLALDTHPTADEILDYLTGIGVQIGRATVFRTLENLVGMGLIGKTCHPGRGVRYDRVTARHHHLVCLRCNAMVDFVDDALDALPLPDTTKSGFQVTDCRVQVRGLCPTCAEQDD